LFLILSDKLGSGTRRNNARPVKEDTGGLQIRPMASDAARPGTKQKKKTERGNEREELRGSFVKSRVKGGSILTVTLRGTCLPDSVLAFQKYRRQDSCDVKVTSLYGEREFFWLGLSRRFLCDKNRVSDGV